MQLEVPVLQEEFFILLLVVLHEVRKLSRRLELAPSLVLNCLVILRYKISIKLHRPELAFLLSLFDLLLSKHFVVFMVQLHELDF